MVSLIVVALSLQAINPQARASLSPAQTAADDAHSSTIEEAQRYFYNSDYDKAAALT